jgi:predicted patatin/cPLA2 family phospholipase
VSGGGSKGAFGGGVAQYLIEKEKKEYDLLIGTSTGSLLVPLIATKQMELLKEGYTTVKQEDIFNINPFKVKNTTNGSLKVGINFKNVLWNVLFRGKKSFGEAKNLKKLIKRFLNEKDYRTIKNSGKEVICTTTNMTLGISEYKSSCDYGYKDFCDWMFASTTVPPFMSVVKKDGYEYADGAILEHAAIQEAINRGSTEIDVIILRKEESELPPELIRNAFHYIFRTMDLMMLEIGKSDTQIGKLKAKDKDVKLNFYYTPRKLTNNSLIFDKEKMIRWWEEGYESAKKQFYKTYLLSGRKKIKLLKDGTIT